MISTEEKFLSSCRYILYYFSHKILGNFRGTKLKTEDFQDDKYKKETIIYVLSLSKGIFIFDITE